MRKSYAELYEDSYGKFTFDFDIFEKYIEIGGLNVLEIGAGSGRLIPLLEKYPTNKYSFVEPDDYMMEILRRKVKESSLQVEECAQEFSFNLAFSDQSFDLILIPFAGITEMSPLIFTLGEAARTLKPGGKVIFSAMNPKKAATLAIGIDRAKSMSSQYAISAENFPISAKGLDFFEVHFEHRFKGGCTKYIVEQVHPTMERWTELLAGLGFEIEASYGDFRGSEFDDFTSPLLQIVAKKVSVFELKSENSKMTSSVYDQMSDGYDNVANGSHYKARAWAIAKLINYKDAYPLVLDIGCATGTIGQVLEGLGVKPSLLFGMDISEQMVRRCRDGQLYDSVVRWDLNRGIPENKFFQFDIVTAFGVLEFVDDLELILKDVRSILKIGGNFFFTLESDKHGRSMTKFNLPNGEITRHAISRESASTLFSRLGFSVEELSEGEAYTSPRTGEVVHYLYCHLKRRAL